jgi:RimJ/RimL family protein N-acetyltransferase
MAAWNREAGRSAGISAISGAFTCGPKRGGTGLGRRLVEAVVADARGQVKRLSLGVATWNSPALAIYRRAGFVAFGTEPAALRVDGVDHDEVLMSLDLR